MSWVGVIIFQMKHKGAYHKLTHNLSHTRAVNRARESPRHMEGAAGWEGLRKDSQPGPRGRIWERGHLWWGWLRQLQPAERQKHPFLSRWPQEDIISR